MKSPYRKGISSGISSAALSAAAVMVANYYRGAAPHGAKLIVNLAADIVDEIEVRAIAGEAEAPRQDEAG
jgi:hypothetical protein